MGINRLPSLDEHGYRQSEHLRSITERHRREVNEYDARCANRPHDPVQP